MLLQPLVENAIKYAVSPQEEGASITLSAQLVGRRLRVAVSVSGPGLREGGGGCSVAPSLAGVGRTVSTGVGLANIRDRLQQAYGEDHRFEIRNPPEGGFTVIIEIPYEAASPRETQSVERPPLAPAALDADPLARPPALSIGTSAA
jgi:sensor histidine kinase YesM